ncbi:MAG: hypothetical protein ACKOQ7_04960 [Actinomycetota bacterium]
MSKREVTTKVSVADLPGALARVITDLGLVDENGRVNREHVRTLGEFVVRFVPAAQPSPVVDPVAGGAGGESPAVVATPADKPRRGRPPKNVAAPTSAHAAVHDPNNCTMRATLGPFTRPSRTSVV